MQSLNRFEYFARPNVHKTRKHEIPLFAKEWSLVGCKKGAGRGLAPAAVGISFAIYVQYAILASFSMLKTITEVLNEDLGK